MIPTLAWRAGAVRVLDQTRLPGDESYLDVRDIEALCEAILNLRVRGAPAIGIAGAYGVALSASLAVGDAASRADTRVTEDAARIRRVRPTAVNLAWGVDRACAVYRDARSDGASVAEAAERCLTEAIRIHEEDLDMSRRMGAAGAELLADGARVITHCNAGGLATGGLGTALAVVYAAAQSGKRIHVYADETRPLLQGARLTAWEMRRAGIPCTLLVDGAAAWLLANEEISACLVGADRIAANGDTANKVGTLSLALAAAHASVPFYVVAPSSTFDPSIGSGAEIAIEQRSADEVRVCAGRPSAPEGTEVWNPAFDVTPAGLVTGWITERGLVRPPFGVASPA